MKVVLHQIQVKGAASVLLGPQATEMIPKIERVHHLA